MSDSEFEDELLMAAGQKGGHDDDSSLDEREEQTAKKRKRAPARRKDDDDDLSSDGGDDDDLYEGEEDKRNLEAMTELQREMILEERAVARDRKRQRKQLQKQLQKGKTSEPKGKEDRTTTEVRASSRRAREMTDKDRAMDRLFAAREARGARRAADGSDDGEDSMSADEDRGGSDVDDESREEDEVDDDDDDIGDTREDRDTQGAEEEDDVSDLKDLLQIQVRRTLLEKWFNQPFFEECMQGVLVRVACGERLDPVTRKKVPNYMLFEVEEVVTERGGKPCSTYKFGPSQVKTNKWLHVRDGKDEDHMQMTMVSNQALTQEEVEVWTGNIRRSKRSMLQRSDFQKIKENIEKAEKYKYTSEDVQKILEQKRAKGVAPANYTLEKLKLMRERDTAAVAGDHDEVERLNQLIAEMDTKFSEDKQNRMRAQGMSSVNRRNKEYNSAMALKQSACGSRMQQAGKPGNAVDVFSRRSTRPRIYWRTSTKDGSENDQLDGSEQKVVEDAEKLSKSQQNMDPVELLKELNLDIDVSIVQDLQQLQQPLPRKLLGNKWQESLSSFAHMDLSNKTLLSVADWKERADALQS